MASRIATVRGGLFLIASRRPFSLSTRRLADNVNDRHHENVDEHRKHQTSKPLNPHMTNTNSTISNEMPSIGKDAPPPEFLTSVDPNFTPKDSVPENTERMMGGTQDVGPESGANKELEVGELAGASFRVEPKRRTGEDMNTLRARLLYQSRKRGTLESDLLFSTFADENLATMTQNQLLQYDLFLDENDWDLYYWCTQEPSPTSLETAEGSGTELANRAVQGQEKDIPVRKEAGEWAQTVGTFKPAYRPVPTRWRNSEILSLIRRHVKQKSAGGVHEAETGIDGQDPAQSIKGTGGGGLGFMPPVRNFDQ